MWQQHYSFPFTPRQWSQHSLFIYFLFFLNNSKNWLPTGATRWNPVFDSGSDLVVWGSCYCQALQVLYYCRLFFNYKIFACIHMTNTNDIVSYIPFCFFLLWWSFSKNTGLRCVLRFSDRLSVPRSVTAEQVLYVYLYMCLIFYSVVS